jgi:hypothetical protein
LLSAECADNVLKVKVENERQSPENEICVFIDDCYRVFIQSEEAAFWIDGSDRGGSTIEGMDMPRRETVGSGGRFPRVGT